MNFKRGDKCYIVENNLRITQAKIVNKQSKYYTIQLVGSCGAIKLPESRIFDTEEQAEKSMNKPYIIDNETSDVFKGKRIAANKYRL